MKVSDSMGEFKNWNRFVKQVLEQRVAVGEKPPQKQRKGSEQVEQTKNSIRKNV